MRFLDIAKRSGRGLLTAKGRTILTALAIAVGGFTLTITLAAGNGVRNYTDNLIADNFDPAELLVGRDREIANNGAPSSTPQEYDETVSNLMIGGAGGSIQVRRVTQEDVEQLRTNPRIEQVREFYQVQMEFITRDNQKRFTGSIEVYNPAQKPSVEQGELPRTGDIDSGSVLLPKSYIEALGFSNGAEAIGKDVSVTVRKPVTTPGNDSERTIQLRIAAITDRPATSLSFGLLPLYISADDARELYEFTTAETPDFERYLYVYARVKDGANQNNVQQVKAELEEQGYFVQSSQDIQKTITQFVNIMQAVVVVFALITLIASIFGVINTQYISVLERTKEIGLMKALGMTRTAVNTLFIIEAAWIGLIGGFIGVVLALLIGIPLNPWISEKIDLGEGNSLLIFDPLQILLLVIGLMIVAAVAGLLPARKAARLDPIEALRTE